jgi:hypothetical protein
MADLSLSEPNFLGLAKLRMSAVRVYYRNCIREMLFVWSVLRLA